MPTHTHPEPASEVLDPVCGMMIAPEDAVGTADFHGQTYYFCNQQCLEQFRADPGRFVAPDGQPVEAPSGPADAEYT